MEYFSHISCSEQKQEIVLAPRTKKIVLYFRYRTYTYLHSVALRCLTLFPHICILNGNHTQILLGN